MTTREEFEAWAEPEGILLGRVISDERYESMTTEWAYRAWKASRAAALEEAAKECDLMQAVFERQARGGDNTGASDFRADAAERCAVGIRALKDAP